MTTIYTRPHTALFGDGPFAQRRPCFISQEGTTTITKAFGTKLKTLEIGLWKVYVDLDVGVALGMHIRKPKLESGEDFIGDYGTMIVERIQETSCEKILYLAAEGGV